MIMLLNLQYQAKVEFIHWQARAEAPATIRKDIAKNEIFLYTRASSTSSVKAAQK